MIIIHTTQHGLAVWLLITDAGSRSFMSHAGTLTAALNEVQ